MHEIRKTLAVIDTRNREGVSATLKEIREATGLGISAQALVMRSLGINDLITEDHDHHDRWFITDFADEVLSVRAPDAAAEAPRGVR